MADPVAQYLARHAEPEAAPLAAQLGRTRDHVVVVPACDESPEFVDPLIDGVDRARGLAIVVVNAADGAPAPVLERNRALLAALARRAGDGLVVVDRSSPGRRLPERQGVGLARKIGCDVALAAWAAGRVESPW